MKSLDYVKEHIEEIEQDIILDRRFTKRFLDFLPIEEWGKYGFKANGSVDLSDYKPKEWSEENILQQLKEDVEFGMQKAIDKRGISAELMYLVCKSWCIVLENGLEGIEYYDYGKPLFQRIAAFYGWEL